MTLTSRTTSFALAAVLLSAGAHADPPVAYEGFQYGSTADLFGKNGGSGWTSAWMDIGGWLNTKTIAEGLEYSGLVTSPGAAQSPSIGEYAISTYSRSFAPISSPDNEMYISFLLRPDAGVGSFGGLRMGQWPKYIYVGSPLGSYVYGMTVGEGYFGDFTTVDVVEGEIALIVLKMAIEPGVRRS